MHSDSVHGELLDLREAVVVCASELPRVRKAAAMLVEEVERRTQIRWPLASALPPAGIPAVIVRLASEAAPAGATGDGAGDGGPAVAEGYRLCAGNEGAAPAVSVVGADERGALFGVGRLLRSLRMGRRRIEVPAGLSVSSAPRFPLRGHQLGYRPKTNSYDGWSLPIWEQYIRDLAIFGANAVELIPPRSDDDADSPHFPLPPLPMMAGMSQILDDYGLDAWIWYPAMDPDYSDPAVVDAALEEWGAVFAALPRINAVFVPGGDPGHTRPRHLLDLLEKQATVLHRTHSQAQMWMSPQGFTPEWMQEFLQILCDEQPAWLSGVVFGPQVCLSLPEMRAAVPARYPIRRYPDITHSRQCQYPVPDWDFAYALTGGREGINPRPLAQARIFRLLQNHAIGFLSYSEGCNDDVNKAVWSALGWDPDADVVEILREYARCFISDDLSEGFAQGLLALERNWQGPLLANSGVYTTLQQFQDLERAATPQDLLNWRFQQALYRAYFDAYTRSRLLYETGLEERAMDALRTAPAAGSLLAMSQAETILDRAVTHRVSEDWRARVFQLAEALFQSIRMQLSVERYQAIDVGRGANLDTLDVPLNSRRWLSDRFAELRALPEEAARLSGLQEIVRWTDPGPGGFYDDLGCAGAQPHLARGPGFWDDPAFLRSSLMGFVYNAVGRISWCRYAEALHDEALTLRYDGLEPGAAYRLRVVYTGDSPRRTIRLVANEGVVIHPAIAKEVPVRPVEFDVPPEATAGGELTLRWYREPGLGGNGRGCQVSEVWLMRRSQGT